MGSVGASQRQTHGVPGVGVVSVLDQQVFDGASHDATNLNFCTPGQVQESEETIIECITE